GDYSMAGRAYDPRLMFAWVNAKLAVMGARQLAGELSIVSRQAAQANGRPFDAEADERRRRDIADGLCGQREPAIRLRHIAHLGVSTLRFAFSLNGLAAPAAVITRHPGTGGGGLAGAVQGGVGYLRGGRATEKRAGVRPGR